MPDGFDGTIDDLDDLRVAAEELDGENSVRMEEMFPAEFMEEHTEFGSFAEFVEESQWDVETQEDFEAIPDEEFDEHVVETTNFDDWEEMYGAAGTEWISDELGF